MSEIQEYGIYQLDEYNLFQLALSIFDREIVEGDLTEDPAIKEIRSCRQYLPSAVSRVLREFDWSFLIKEITLDEDDDSPGLGFDHGLKIPEGVFKIVHVGSDFPYQVAGGRIYFDDHPGKVKVYGIYKTFTEDDVPPDFLEAIAYALAFKIAPLLAPAGRLDSLILQRYSWVLTGLMSAECHNNARGQDDLDTGDLYG